ALHRAFVENNAEQMLQNLALAVDWLQGVNLSKDLRLLALKSLSLVVPVVSTTFAALPRFLAGIGREEIGWLLIDEAGQALPQAAAGAIWRAKRTVVVGDPRQLEPIVVLPTKMEEALARHYQVGDPWRPSQTSCQVLADQATEMGTYLTDGGGEKIWVGAPLRVHRRCNDPMFSISNIIAYDGMMIHDKKGGGDRKPLSQWIHVAGGKANGQWIEEEGDALRRLIAWLKTEGHFQGDDIFLISPFRDVARELKRFARGFGISRPHEQVGTVHTTQGKEAQIVILVLGGDPKKTGDKQWAASKPNLLNVAVSRAKETLVVIGNSDLWGDLPYFRVAHHHLGGQVFKISVFTPLNGA
ncbi:MAG: DNA2/NAM7 family helicase, partial [Syntrophales bacterium]|nr:DNA2/NAM7 family helicase [Syntrophales bacterium]